MNKIYKEPEFNIVLTDAVDIITGSTDTEDFGTTNGYTNNGPSGPSWGMTGIEI